MLGCLGFKLNTGAMAVMLGLGLVSIVDLARAQETTSGTSPTQSPGDMPLPEAASKSPVVPEATISQGLSETAEPKTETPVPEKVKFDLVDAAARYVALVKEADRMTLPNSLASESVASALMNTARISSKDITEGMGAYVALSIASDPAFRAAVRTSISLLGRDEVVKRMREDPDTFITMIDQATGASAVANGAIVGSFSKLERAQSALGEAAYSVQKERWAMQVIDTQATLAQHRAAAGTPSGLTPFVAEDLPVTPIPGSVDKRYILAAAHRVLDNDVAAGELLDKPLGRMCMNRVQLNVRQCLAASQHPYEHLFCLSRHSFGEALGCVKDAAK
jgi:hypothetical protein